MPNYQFLYLFVFLLVSILIYFISKALINKIFKKISINTKTNFDDLLIKNHIPSYISFLFPLLFLYSLIPFFGDKYPSIFDGFSKLIEILAVLFLIFIVRSLYIQLETTVNQVFYLKINQLIVTFRFF